MVTTETSVEVAEVSVEVHIIKEEVLEEVESRKHLSIGPGLALADVTILCQDVRSSKSSAANPRMR